MWWSVDNPSDIRCWEGKEEAEDKVEDENLENFLDGGAKSKESLVEGKSERCKIEGTGLLQKYKRFRTLSSDLL